MIKSKVRFLQKENSNLWKIIYALAALAIFLIPISILFYRAYEGHRMETGLRELPEMSFSEKVKYLWKFGDDMQRKNLMQ